MRNVYLTIALLLLSPSESFGASVKQSPQNNTSEYNWKIASGSKLLSENGIEYNVTEFLNPVHAVKKSSKELIKTDPDGKKIYSFNDIEILAQGNNEFEILNNTPDRINFLVVQVNEYEYPILISMDTALTPFSNSTILFNENISNIKLYNTSEMFLPQITLTGNGITAEEGTLCTSVCYSDPDSQQGRVYEIGSSNIHKAINHKQFLPELTNFYLNDENNGCPAGKLTDCDENVAYMNYMKMSAKGHRLSLKVLSGPYSNEGVGGGKNPTLSDMTTNSGGWASIWTNYITTGTPNSRPFDLRTQKTLFHESAHGFGYNHKSGMTYGFADYYGLEFLPKYFDEKDITGESELKPSSIIPVLVESNDKHLKYKLLKLEENQSTNLVNSRVITEEKISRKDRFFIDNNELYYEVMFEEAPTSAVVIQFFDNTSNRVFTTREIANFYNPEPIIVDNLTFKALELPRKVLTDRDYIHVNAICKKYLPGSQGATKGQYEKLWNSDDFNSELLNGTYYISSNISQSGKRWRINMKDRVSFNMTSEDRYTAFGEHDSLLCVQ